MLSNNVYLQLMIGGKYVSAVSTLIILADMLSHNMFLQLIIGGRHFFSTLGTPAIIANVLSKHI